MNRIACFVAPFLSALVSVTWAQSGSISTSQNPCTIPTGQSSCTVSITWSASGGGNPGLFLRGSPNVLVNGDPGNPTYSPNWISTSHVFFDLRTNYADPSSAVLASREVWGEPAPVPNGDIVASPETCAIPEGSSTCTSTIIWSAQHALRPGVFVRETGVLVSGTPTIPYTPNWINTVGYHFDLRNDYNDVNSQLLDSVFVKGNPPAPPALTELFDNFAGVTGTCTATVLDPTPPVPPADPETGTPMSCSQPPQTWHTLQALDGSTGLSDCIGSGSTACWTVSNSQMSFVGRKESAPNAESDGFPLLSGLTFDRTRYLSVEADVTARCELNGMASSANCFLSLNFIADESDYRGLSLAANGNPANAFSVGAQGPYMEVPLYPIGSGSQPAVPFNTWVRLRVDYLGPAGGAWKYYLNGQLLNLNAFASGSPPSEGGTHLNAALQATPRVGLYMVGRGVVGSAARGCLDNIRAYVTDAERPANASGGPQTAASCP